MLDKSNWILVASLLVALGSWGATFSSWAEVVRVSNVFGLLGIIGGVVLAWFGTSPLSGGSNAKSKKVPTAHIHN
jgi:hypothetical protein